MAGAIVAVPSDISTASSRRAKTLTRGQSVVAPFAIALKTPLVSVGALRAPSYPQLPNASLGGRFVAGSDWVEPRGVGAFMV